MGDKAKSAALLTFDQAIVSGGNFVVTVVCARQLSAVEFGQFSICWLVVLFASTLVMAAIVFPMMSQAPLLDPSAMDGYVEANVQLFALLATMLMAMGAVAAVIIGLLTSSEKALLVGGITVCAVLVQYQELIRRVLMLQNKTTRLIASDAVTALLRIASLIVIVSSGPNSVGYALLLIGGASLVGSIPHIPSRSFPSTSLRAAKKAWRLNSKAARWLLPAGLMQWSSVNYFLVLASMAFPVAMVGHLRLCQNLAALTNPIVQLSENLLPVRASQKYRDTGSRALLAYVTRTAGLGGFAFGLLVPIAWFYGERILELVYGAAFPEARLTLAIFMAMQILVFLVVPLRAALRTIGETKTWFHAYSLATLTAMASTPLILSKPGLVTTSLAMLIVMLVIIFYAGICLNKRLEND